MAGNSSDLGILIILIMIIAVVVIIKKNTTSSSPSPTPPPTPPTPPPPKSNGFAVVTPSSILPSDKKSIIILPSVEKVFIPGRLNPITPPGIGIPQCISQIKDNSGFILGTYDYDKDQGYVYKTNSLTNPSWTDTQVPFGNGIIPTSLEQINDKTYVLVTYIFQFTGKGNTVYQSNSSALDSTTIWNQLDTRTSNFINTVIQAQDNTFYHTLSDGGLYSSNTLDFSKAWNAITTVDDKSASIKLFSIKQLYDKSFLGIGCLSSTINDPRNLLYSTPSISGNSSTWTLVNLVPYFTSITEILN